MSYKKSNPSRQQPVRLRLRSVWLLDANTTRVQTPNEGWSLQDKELPLIHANRCPLQTRCMPCPFLLLQDNVPISRQLEVLQQLFQLRSLVCRHTQKINDKGIGKWHCPNRATDLPLWAGSVACVAHLTGKIHTVRVCHPDCSWRKRRPVFDELSTLHTKPIMNLTDSPLRPTDPVEPIDAKLAPDQHQRHARTIGDNRDVIEPVFNVAAWAYVIALKIGIQVPMRTIFFFVAAHRTIDVAAWRTT